MALTICKECRNKVSSNASNCIHCGCPVETTNQMICVINGIEYDLSYFFEKVVDKNNDLEQMTQIVNEIREFTDTTKALSIYQYIRDNRDVPKEFNCTKQSDFDKKLQKNSQQSNTPHCPRCGSTAITAGQRGFKLTTGFLGSNKTVNRCANCGHTWKPGK